MNPDEIRELGEDIDMYFGYVANLIEENEEIGVEVIDQIASFIEDIRQLGMTLGKLHKSHVAKVPEGERDGVSE